MKTPLKRRSSVRYLLLFCGTMDGQRAYEALDDATLAERFGQVREWFDAYGERLGARGQLQPPNTATTVHLERGDAPLVTDGPFLEGNEVIGGYCEVDVAELDDALAMARAWPGGGSVEVRPLIER
jgi:hypothetical protein